MQSSALHDFFFGGVSVEEPRRFPFEFGIGLGCRASSTACIVL